MLSFVKEHPECANQVGLIVLDCRTIAVNATIFAKFTGRKPNSVRLSLRTHHIPRCRRVPQNFVITLENVHHWNIHEARDDLFGPDWKSVLSYERHPGECNVGCDEQKNETGWNDWDDWNDEFDFDEFDP
jgi:hypothetical protein